jgi:uncharacterized protein DUF6112
VSSSSTGSTSGRCWPPSAGLFLSILVYAVANRSGNHHYAQGGKVGILVMGPLAMVAGAGPAIINFFAELGQQVR